MRFQIIEYVNFVFCLDKTTKHVNHFAFNPVTPRFQSYFDVKLFSMHVIFEMSRK